MSAPTFRIKICGVTNADDALAVVHAGADAIGLNFYSRSKRCVNFEEAASIVGDVPREIAKVGVFVNPSTAEVHAALQARLIDMFHVKPSCANYTNYGLCAFHVKRVAQ